MNKYITKVARHMKNTQQTLNTSNRAKLRLTEVERLIKQHRIIVPPLSRRTLTKMCEEGIEFETVGRSPSRYGWLIYEDSFWAWANALDDAA